MSERRRRWILGALIAGTSLSLVVVRVLWSSRVDWREAEAHLAAGDEGGAVDRYGRAARLYAPGNPWCARSLVRLEELALSDEKAGKPEPAKKCMIGDAPGILLPGTDTCVKLSGGYAIETFGVVRK